MIIFRHLASFWSMRQKRIRGFKLTTSGQVIGERKTKWRHHGNTPASLDGRDAATAAAAVAAIITVPVPRATCPHWLQPLFHLCIFPPVVCTCLPRIGKETARAGLYYSVSYDLCRTEGCRSGRLYNTVTVRYRNTRHSIVTTSNKSPGIFHILVTTTQRASSVRTFRVIRVFSLWCNETNVTAAISRACHAYIRR